MAGEKKGEENNGNEAGRRAIASHYRVAARLAWFMPGPRVGINHAGRASKDSRLACEFPKP